MDPIQLSKPSITDEEVAAAERVLRSGWLVNGPEGRAFEEELASRCGVRAAAVVSTGTSALHLSLHALLRERAHARPRRLLVPAFTFPATANVAHFEGLPVRLSDVDQDTYCLPADALRRFFTAGADGADGEGDGLAMVVHQFGYPAPLPADVPHDRVISDAACAIFVPQALLGRCACLSFHPRKLLTTGEGGAVLSNDTALIDEIRGLRNHGLLSRPGQEMFDTAVPGLNYRLPEISAAVGRVQLRRLPGLIAAQREHAAHYRARLSGRLLLQADHPDRIWQTVAVLLPEGTARAALRERLRADGIETQVASYGLHRLTAYQAAPVQGAGLPVASALHERGLALPLWAHMRADQVDYVCDRLLSWLDRGREGAAAQ